MNLGALMDELAGKAAAAPLLAGGGGASATPGSRIVAPCAVVPYPERIGFDQTYARGRDRVTASLSVWVGLPNEPQSRDLLTAFCDGNGPNSIKELLEDGPGNTYTTCDTVAVVGVDIDAYEHGGPTYLVAIFELDIYGPGED